ncbi:lyase family protein [Vibrio parahaemolyticus]|nr:lyase family protein [Vibrio parahaemolyticus]
MATLSDAPKTANQATRIEEDLLGQRHVPADAYYGIHTLRAIENFNISNVTISDVPEFVRGMVMTKKAAALANKELGAIPKEVANYILEACDLILETGKCMDQFPSDVFQGGAGTSVNMNTNEVIANVALELMGKEKANTSSSTRTTTLTRANLLTVRTQLVSVSRFTTAYTN